MIKIERLSKNFGKVKALDELIFEIPEDEITNAQRFIKEEMEKADEFLQEN